MKYYVIVKKCDGVYLLDSRNYVVLSTDDYDEANKCIYDCLKSSRERKEICTYVLCLQKDGDRYLEILLERKSL
jgi:uncharacterized protein HemY